MHGILRIFNRTLKKYLMSFEHAYILCPRAVDSVDVELLCINVDMVNLFARENNLTNK